MISVVTQEPSRESLLQLLELQRVDSTIDRLETRRRNLPEQAALEVLEEQLALVEKSLGEQQAIVDDVTARQRKLDDEIEKIASKMTKSNERLYSGNVGNPRELADLQEEVELLKRRKSALEDSDLEIMESREAGEKILEGLDLEAEGLRRQVEEAVVVRDRASVEVDEQLETARLQRAEWVPRFDAELLELYDDLRASKEGIGAAALIEGVCQGCHMRLPNQEVERVRKTAGLIFCDECRRILVVL